MAAVTAASEISIIATSRLRLRRMAAEGSKRAAVVLKILETPERFFSTILVSNNIVNTLTAVLVTAVVTRLMGSDGWDVAVSTFVAAFLIIIFETTSKTIAASYAEKMALFIAVPVRIMIKLFYPVVIGFEMVVSFILRVIGVKSLPKASLVTDDEIRAMIKVGQEEGSLQKDKYSMITKVFALHDAVVRSVMTPKKEIFSIDVNSGIDDILSRALESGYSRIPVYKDNPDNIIGVINMKDLLMLSANKDLIVMQDVIYPPTVVSESKKVIDLLKEFQKGHTHIAIVVNGDNRIQGVITLEDLVEEIVGEIEDEYDIRATNYKTKHIG